MIAGFAPFRRPTPNISFWWFVFDGGFVPAMVVCFFCVGLIFGCWFGFLVLD